MKVAIALAKDQRAVYQGPFGHAPYYAVFEVHQGDGCQEIERIENPFAREEGGNKPAKLKTLLAGTQLWIGRRFGHDDPHHHHHPAPPVPTRRTEAESLAAVLKELGCASTT